jgi:hypothetical protein
MSKETPEELEARAARIEDDIAHFDWGTTIPAGLVAAARDLRLKADCIRRGVPFVRVPYRLDE